MLFTKIHTAKGQKYTIERIVIHKKTFLQYVVLFLLYYVVICKRLQYCYRMHGLPATEAF